LGSPDGLPGKIASLAEVAQATVDALQRAGAINDGLFEYLEKGLPRRAREVDFLRRQYVGRVTAQSRGVLAQAVDSPVISPIKILLVCANPRGTDRLRLGEEDRTLRECIQLSTNRECFKVETLNAATIDDLRRELLRHKYDIVQISGHGTHAGLMFEDVHGDCMTPNPAALSELLQRRGVKTVVLNACYSLSAGSFRGMGLEYTVAMEGPIADRAAVEFTRGFYDALGEGLKVVDAYAEGVSCCKLKGLSLLPALLEKGELISGGVPTTPASSESVRNVDVANPRLLPRGLD